MADNRPIPPTMGDEEEIVEKKPSSPMASALLMIIFVTLIVGIYIDWSTLSQRYWNPKMYLDQTDAEKDYKAWRDKNVRPFPTDGSRPDFGGSTGN